MQQQARDNFVFIHINKTGGSSVKAALAIPFEHKTALEKIAELGRERWDKAFTFTVIRNPWDKVVSHYHYRVQTNQTDLGENPIDFREWVQRAYGMQDTKYYNNPKMFMPQLDWIADGEGTILVDDVMRFETIGADFDRVLEKLSRSANLPHVKKSSRANYRDYYDEKTRDIVQSWFALDIEKFGYAF